MDQTPTQEAIATLLREGERVVVPHDAIVLLSVTHGENVGAITVQCLPGGPVQCVTTISPSCADSAA